MTTRLVALILIPAVVAGILAGLRVRDGVTEAGLYARIEKLATLGDRVAALVHELESERALTVRFLTSARNGQEDELRRQHSVTDRAAAQVRGSLGGIGDAYSAQVRAKVRDVRYRLDSLPGLREVAGQGTASPFSALDIYGQLIVAMLDLDDLVAQGSPSAEVAESTRAFAALARAKDYASQESALVTSVLLTGRFANPADRERLLTLRSQQDSQIALFRSTAETGQRQLYEDTVTGPEAGQVELTYQQVLVASGRSPTMSVRPLRPRDSVGWAEASGTRIGQMREVERNLTATIVRDSRELKDNAYLGVLINAALLLIGLLLAALATGVVARSLVRPLRRLQAGALEVAGTRLPGLVDRLRDPEAAAEGIEVEPIDVDSTDEIGRVARAFDEVHREAVRLAADEAVLRGNINAMFVNLSRRSQSLIERQLRLIEELEQNERDEDQLGNLFRLDHLATRMRRNNENLLVLGGQDQVRRWTRPVPLIDVVRASLSEVEQYERVAVRVQGDMTVAGPVVNDLVHLLAELVENATVFSPEHTRVTVSGQLLSGGGAMLQITDNGVGMSGEDLEQANWRLANPPVIDFSAARRMGLFVVGRLAVRHGIRVELRAAQGGGLTAFVVLPEMVISPAESGGIGSRAFGGLDDGAARPPEYAGMPSSPSAVAGLPPVGTPPATGPAAGPGGLFGQDGGSGEYGVPRPRTGGAGSPERFAGTGTGPHPIMSDDGPPPGRDAFRDRPPGPGHTGPQPVIGGTGPLQPPFGQTGPQPIAGDSGAYPSMPGGTAQAPGPGARDHAPGYDREPEAPPRARADEPGREPGRLPVRRPGAQHPARRGPGGGSAPGGRPGTPSGPVHDDDPLRTGPLPAFHEQAAPDHGLPEYGASEYGAPGQGAPEYGAPGQGGTGHGLPEQGVPAGYGGSGRGGPGYGGSGHGGSGNGLRRGPAEDQGLPEPARGEHPAEQATPPGVPGRSPIFDAMRSEWFQRRTDQTPEDPVKGWESPADAGFQAAEAVREPAAGERTAAGLPKRVPGKNRVPGAVASRSTPAAQPPPQAAARPGGRPPVPGSGQSADTVRNRFASLQRGVQRGRTETRGTSGPGEEPGTGTTGELPSHGEGENGGTR
ncbi:hypothetical protein GCM10023085_01030 [Actinomadura viridis]|uniref:histidine kinase n=1 Tax=Actinomadura viridis TaxID=58110 RepID=A0A931DQM5_9ACTN|nr:nitrate- and nitrite sensing domain-containing protein [Actinomadura viridis]MBG6090923.1 signal transduction histidine kinase [Actinomadura viridis]